MTYVVTLSCIFEVEANSPGEALNEACETATEFADNIDLENIKIGYYDD